MKESAGSEGLMQVRFAADIVCLRLLATFQRASDLGGTRLSRV